jgi:hypothetical protein
MVEEHGLDLDGMLVEVAIVGSNVPFWDWAIELGRAHSTNMYFWKNHAELLGRVFCCFHLPNKIKKRVFCCGSFFFFLNQVFLVLCFI